MTVYRYCYMYFTWLYILYIFIFPCLILIFLNSNNDHNDNDNDNNVLTCYHTCTLSYMWLCGMVLCFHPGFLCYSFHWSPLSYMYKFCLVYRSNVMYGECHRIFSSSHFHIIHNLIIIIFIMNMSNVQSHQSLFAINDFFLNLCFD